MNSPVFILANSLSKVCPNGCGLPTSSASPSTVQSIYQIVLGIVGAVALLVIVIAGLRYITSAGDPQKAANARNTIILALVGLVIAISAYAILTFVVKGL